MQVIHQFEEHVRSHSFPFVDRPLTADEQEIVMASLALAGEAGEVANHVKKSLRDGIPPVTSDYLLELGACLHYLVRMVQYAGYSLDEIASMNITKLTDRLKNDEAFALKVAKHNTGV